MSSLLGSLTEIAASTDHPHSSYHVSSSSSSSSSTTSRRESFVREFFNRTAGNVRRQSSVRQLFGFVRSSAPQRYTKPVRVDRESTTRLQKLVSLMRICLRDLGADATDRQLERWTCLIYESMSAPSRTFHSVQHVFDISMDADSLQTIAAFFHDVIYYSIDGGLSPAQEMELGGIVSEDDDGRVILSDIGKESDELMAMVAAIFGFSPGQVLNPFRGLNEFLSAALAVRCLRDTLSMPYLARIATCIEATIPFRGPEDGKGATELLFERLASADDTFDLGLGEGGAEDAVRRAVDLANRDVGNFATTDQLHFLSNTWNLLPESNINLRHTTVFRISNFTLALKKMAGFFSSLDPDLIFCSFRGEPGESDMADITEKARVNVDVSLKYMRCKLLSISVLGALAELTGGDAPVAMFLGDLPEPGYASPSIEDFVRSDGPAEGVRLDSTVYVILRDGRETESKFDLKNSPLAAYLYGLIGDEGLYRSLEYAVYPMDEENAKRLLGSLPREAVSRIASACSELAVTRSDELRRIADEHSTKSD